MRALSILLLLVTLCIASTADAAYTRVFCETLLSPLHLDATDMTVRNHLVGFDFRADIDRRATNAAFAKLGLDGDLMRSEFLPLTVHFEETVSNTLQLHVGKFQKQQMVMLTLHPFLSPRPSIWRSMVLNIDAGTLNHQKLIEELPPVDDFETPVGVIRGISTDVDSQGVRSYVGIENRVSSLGIDVPCEEVRQYLDGDSFHVLTRFNEFCRVPILYFK